MPATTKTTAAAGPRTGRQTAADLSFLARENVRKYDLNHDCWL